MKRAALGFGLTAAAVLAVGGVQLLLASTTVRIAGFDPATNSWVLSQYRAVLLSFYVSVVAIVLVYWLLAGTLGGAQFPKIKSANVTLALAGLTFAVAMVMGSVVRMPTLFEAVCPILGISDTMPPLPSGIYSFDGQTPCEAFANVAAPTVLLGLPSILLLVSAILRIILSRRG